jgi:hypothetical protein
MITQTDFEAICLAAGMKKSAIVDALAQFPDDETPVTQWLPAQRAEKPHWFEQAADNKAPELYSLKAQAAHVIANGEAATRALMAANGMQLGQVKPAAKEDAETVTGARNPYSDKFHGTQAERQARIASLIKSGGTKLAASLAKSAGKKIDGSPLNKK